MARSHALASFVALRALALALGLVAAASLGAASSASPAGTADRSGWTGTAGAGSAADIGAATGQWPLRPPPAVVRGFDPPDAPWAAGHRGVDLAGRAGQTVRAAVGGRVTFAGALAGRGVVVVDHGDTRTTYEPVRAGVRVGLVLAAGSPLGALEAVGSHCAPAPCLHWGWLRGDTYLDPLTLVGAGPVRLLPLSGISRTASLARAQMAPPVLGCPLVAHARGWACW